MWGDSSLQGIGELCFRDTGELSLRAYGGFAAEHRASAARSGADVSSLGRTSQYYCKTAYGLESLQDRLGGTHAEGAGHPDLN